jgi:hypothetical protein
MLINSRSAGRSGGEEIQEPCEHEDPDHPTGAAYLYSIDVTHDMGY